MKDIYDELFDCGTDVPGNPHQAAKLKGEGRGLLARDHWRGIRDGVLASVHAKQMNVTTKWLQNFNAEVDKRRFSSETAAQK